MANTLIILGFIIFVIIFCRCIYDNSCEGMTVESNEAVQTVGAVYNKDNMVVTNLNVTDTLDANIVNANTLKTDTCDFVIGRKCTRGDCKSCRAIVKDDGNILTLNYGNDFTGGTKINSDLNVTGQTTVNRLYTSGAVNAPNGMQSHFPYVDGTGVHENYIRDFAHTMHLFGDTYEITVHWSDVATAGQIISDNLVNTHAKLKEGNEDILRGKIFVSYRATQLYDTGVCMYFTYAYYCHNFKNVETFQKEIEKTLKESASQVGATLSHHHGIGKLKKDAYKKRYPHGEDVTKGLNATFDPNNTVCARNNYF